MTVRPYISVFFFLDKNDESEVDSFKAIGCVGEIPPYGGDTEGANGDQSIRRETLR